MLKRFLKGFWRLVKWHLPTTLASVETLKEHFNLSDSELSMLHSCTVHKVLQEYVCFNEDRSEAYMVYNVSQSRKLIKMRRKNEKR